MKAGSEFHSRTVEPGATAEREAKMDHPPQTDNKIATKELMTTENEPQPQCEHKAPGKKTDDDKLDAFLRIQTPYIQGSISHADQKASFLIFGVVAFFGILVTHQAAMKSVANIFQGKAGWMELAACCSIATLLAGAIAACCVVYPRFSEEAASLVSWASIPLKYKTRHEYAEAIRAAGNEDVIGQQLQHHYYRCQVCNLKWRLLRIAYWLSFIGIGLAIVYTCCYYTWDIPGQPNQGRPFTGPAIPTH